MSLTGYCAGSGVPANLSDRSHGLEPALAEVLGIHQSVEQVKDESTPGNHQLSLPSLDKPAVGLDVE